MNLSTLTNTEAVALERLVGIGVNYFVQRGHEARAAIAAGGAPRWIAENKGRLDDALRLEAMGRRFEKAAHRRAFEAGREEARAIRSIEAFALAAGGVVLAETAEAA